MMDQAKHVKDVIQGKTAKGRKRSSRWRKVRAAHLEQYPRCFVCGGKKKIECHHILPFHLFPEYELNPNNLLTLCERKKYGINCHLLIGHLGNYKRRNKSCRKDGV